MCYNLNQMNKDLNNYIKKALEGGMSEDNIESNLINSGWNKNDIDKAFKAYHGSSDDLNKSDVGMFTKYKIILVVVLGVLIIGGVATATYYVFNNESGMTSQQVIEETINQMSDIDSLSFDALAKAYKEDDPFSSDVSFSGVSNFSSNLSDFNDQQVYFEGGMTGFESDQRLSLGFEYRVVDNSIFIQVDHLPIIIPQEMSSQFVGKWIEINEEDIQSQMGNYRGDLDQDYDEYALTEDQKERTKDVLINADWFQEITMEDNQSDIYLIEYVINLEEFKKVIHDIRLIIMETFEEEDAQELFNDMDDFENYVNDFLEDIEEISGSAVIDKNSYYLKELNINSIVNIDEDVINIDLSLSLDDFNEPVEIEKPQDTQSINELLGIPEEPSNPLESNSNDSNFQANILNALGFIFSSK